MKNFYCCLLLVGLSLHVFAQKECEIVIDTLLFQSFVVDIGSNGLVKKGYSEFYRPTIFSYSKEWHNSLKLKDKIRLNVDLPDTSLLVKQFAKLTKKVWPIHTDPVYGLLFPISAVPPDDLNWFLSYISAISIKKHVEYKKDRYVPLQEFTYTDTPKDFSITTPNALKATFSRSSKENEIVVKHLKETQGFYTRWDPANNPTFQEISRNFQTLRDTIDRLLVIDSSRYLPNEHPFNIEVMKNLVRLYPYQRNIDKTFEEVINANREWIKRWLWYTGGEVKLNPFPYYDTAPLLKTAYTQKRLVEDRAALLKSSVASGAFSNFSANEQNLTRLSAALVAINGHIAQLKSDSATSTKWLIDTQKKSKVLYEGEWPVSSLTKINWLTHYTYDAKNKKLTSQTKSDSLPNFTAAQDQRVVLLHNVPSGTDITVKASEKALEPKSSTDSSLSAPSAAFGLALKGIENINKLMNAIGPLLGTAIKVAGVSTGFGASSTEVTIPGSTSITQTIDKLLILLDSVQVAFKYFKINPKDSINFATDLSKISSKYSALRGRIVKNIGYKRWKSLDKAKDTLFSLMNPKIISNYRNTKLKHDWLSEQTVPLLSIEDYKDDKIPAYRTVALYPEDSLTLKKTKEVSYELYIDKTQLAKSKYQKHELTRWWPAMGGVWVNGNRGYETYDATKGTFVQEPISRFEAIVGAKLYPCKTNISYKNRDAQLDRLGKNYNRKRGNSILNRAFLFGGLGVTKRIFKNYALGAGIDLVPGLSVQAGCNFISQKSYELDKGVIKNESEYLKRFFYYGISVDPGIITKIIGLF